jgi:uncharacterized protein
MIKYIPRFCLFSFFSIALLLACKKDSTELELTFDRGPMLVNYANNVIAPRYLQYELATRKLQTHVLSFCQNPQITTLNEARNAYVLAYTNYQSISTFEFGPAETIILRANTNIFPTDPIQISNNISNASLDLTLSENNDAKGFPALDFLLFGANTNEQNIVDSFVNQPLACSYLLAITKRLHTDALYLLDQWQNNYKNQFIAANGTDVSSGVGQLINQLNLELDLLKNAKIAIPLGLQTLNIAQPQKTEALYSLHLPL